MPTLFTKIIQGEVPCEKILDSENEFAFLDINPSSEGHTLVVPKDEVARFEDLSPQQAHSLIDTVQIVARAVMRAMDTTHYNISLNNGTAAGQEVFHVHFHVVPRYEGRRRMRQQYPRGRMEEVGAAIRNALAEAG